MKYRVILLLAVAAFVAGCEVFIDCSDHPSCEQTMDHVYKEDCAFFDDNEVQLTKSEAIDGCEDDLKTAKDIDCESEYNDLLDCLVQIDKCDECSDEFDDLFNCWG